MSEEEGREYEERLLVQKSPKLKMNGVAGRKMGTKRRAPASPVVNGFGNERDEERVD